MGGYHVEFAERLDLIAKELDPQWRRRLPGKNINNPATGTPYPQADHATVAMDRGENIYISVVEHNGTAKGALVFYRTSFGGATPAALLALQGYESPEVAAAIVAHYTKMPPALRDKARDVLVSRPAWAA